MEAQGWIRLYRKMVDWEWYTDYPTFKLFIHLLLIANHTPRQWRGQTVNAGELITSIGSLSEQTGLTEQQIRTAIRKLESTGEIERKTTNKNTLIIVMNYGVYQSVGFSEQQTTNNQATIKQQTSNKQTTTNNNDKNDKNENNDKNMLACIANARAIKVTPELTGDDYYDDDIKMQYYREGFCKWTPHVPLNGNQLDYLFSHYTLEEVQEEAEKLEAYIVKHNAHPRNVFLKLCEWLERDRDVKI